VVLATGLLCCLAAVGAAAEPARTDLDLPITDEGVIGHAPYYIHIPENWNGGLVLWAHGYGKIGNYPWQPPEHALMISTGKNTFAVALEKGYAVAVSRFSVIGFAVREGSLDTEMLRDHFVRSYGSTSPTIIAGNHGGGYLTYYIMEQFPEGYDGGLAFSGGGSSTLIAYKKFFDVRLLFDYYFPGLPGDVLDWSWNLDDIRELVPALVSLQPPERAAMFLRMAGLKDVRDLTSAMLVGCYNLRDVFVSAGGNPFDNTNTVYSGSDDDATLNREIPRYRADPAAEEYMRRWFTVTGRITSPLLAVNVLDDPIVPITVTEDYDNITRLAGTNHLFAQMWVDQRSVAYRRGTVERAFELLEAWIREGKRPIPGELPVED
jgi:hypothetical protein